MRFRSADIRVVNRRCHLSFRLTPISQLVGSRPSIPSAGTRPPNGPLTGRLISVHETFLRRRHRYVTVISNAETGKVLGVVKLRDFRALSGLELELTLLRAQSVNPQWDLGTGPRLLLALRAKLPKSNRTC